MRIEHTGSYQHILIGLTCAALECFIAPYNDYVIRNAKRDEFWVHLFSGA